MDRREQLWSSRLLAAIAMWFAVKPWPGHRGGEGTLTRPNNWLFQD